MLDSVLGADSSGDKERQVPELRISELKISQHEWEPRKHFSIHILWHIVEIK